MNREQLKVIAGASGETKLVRIQVDDIAELDKIGGILQQLTGTQWSRASVVKFLTELYREMGGNDGQ